MNCDDDTGLAERCDYVNAPHVIIYRGGQKVSDRTGLTKTEPMATMMDEVLA